MEVEHYILSLVAITCVFSMCMASAAAKPDDVPGWSWDYQIPCDDNGDGVCAVEEKILKINVNVYNRTNPRGNPIEALPQDDTTFYFNVKCVGVDSTTDLGRFEASQASPAKVASGTACVHYQIEAVDIPDGYCVQGTGKSEVTSSAMMKFYKCEEPISWDIIKPFGRAWGLMKKWVDNFVKGRK